MNRDWFGSIYHDMDFEVHALLLFVVVYVPLFTKLQHSADIYITLLSLDTN